MLLTYFPPRTPRPAASLDDRAYKAAHATQTTPAGAHDLDELGLLDYIRASARVGRAGDAGYIISGDCTTTRKESGEASFVLIDYDDNPAGPDWQALDTYAGFAWTTASGHPHWRVLIPLLRPMTHGKLRCPFPGGHIRNRTQPAFLPTHRTDVNVIQWRLLEGTQLLDGETLGKPVAAYAPAAASMLGAVFTAAGMAEGEQADALIVRCPWQHEHTGGAGGGCVVFHDDEEHTGLGKFYCAHGHCSKRGSADALEALRALPAAASELEHWPEPGIGGWERTAAPQPCPLVKDSEAKKPAPGAFALMSAEDFDKDEPIPWVIEGLVSAGEPTMIVGGAGSGKTSAMVALALSVATGRDVWGRFPVRKAGPVVHIDYEQGKTLRRTYRAFAAGMGLDAAALVRDGKLRIAPLPREQLLDANVTDRHLSVIGKELVALTQGASLCVINSLTASTNKVNENDAKIAAVFNLLARITELTGCAFVVLHHSGRADNLRARGSSAIDGAVQTVFQISHNKGDKHTIWKHTKDRPAGGIQDHFKLVWTLDDPAQRLMVETLQEDAPGPGIERPEDRMRRAILWVMVNKGLSGKDRILELVRGKKTAKRSVWDDMLVRGLIEHAGSRYLVAAGVVPPKEQPDGVRDEEDDYEPEATGHRPNTGRSPNRYGS